MNGFSIQQAVLEAGLQPLTNKTADHLATYLELLLKWNQRFNLTAVREPEAIVRRHFVESLFCAQLVPGEVKTLLDYGSGAGFPGIPIALCLPQIAVTLAESQLKKASFLREAVRILSINVAVYGQRVEAMPAGQKFDCVTLRAVDRMEEACMEASRKVAYNGWLAVFATRASLSSLTGPVQNIVWRSPEQVPGSHDRILVFGHKLSDY